MDFHIEFDREEDGRWIAEITELPGVMAYGISKKDAESKVEALALRVIADKIEREHSTTNHVLFAIA
jgi:predicted RNase H-like HicB family nuclease